MRLSPRRKYKLLFTLTLLLAALLICLAYAWVRSYSTATFTTVRHATSLPAGAGYLPGKPFIPLTDCIQFTTQSTAGALDINFRYGTDQNFPPGWSAAVTYASPEYPRGPSPRSFMNHLGFGFFAFPFDVRTLYSHTHFAPNFPSNKINILWLPWWFPALLLTLATLASAHLTRKQHRRLTQNLCPACGYDLRQSPTACPECDTKPLSPGA